MTKENTIDGITFAALVENAARKLGENVETINKLNVFPIPDGDTGDNMYRTLTGGVSAMQRETENSVSKKSRALADGMLFNARGNSGVILSQLFAGLADGFSGIVTAGADDFINAFGCGVKKGYSAVVTPVEGTILTVAAKPYEKLKTMVGEIKSIRELFDYLLREVKTTLEKTPDLLPVLKEAGVVDSGGVGLMCIVEGVVEALDGNLSAGNRMAERDTRPDPDLSGFNEYSVMEFGYCTEFLLQLQWAKTDVEKFSADTVTDYLKTIGDSIVAFKTGTVVKVHVHTFTPYKALEFCRQYGEFLTVKIENMTLQHNESLPGEKKAPAEEFNVKRARRKYGLCAVADGEGVVKLFIEMGADYVINGGQGNNPSINDFIRAFDYINADNIYVLPDNPNIFLAAKQAREMFVGSKIYVLDCKDIGEAYSVLSMLDYGADDADEIAQNLTENLNGVVTGMVSRSIRDAELNGINIKNGEYVGFTGKKILVAHSDKIKAAVALCEKLRLSQKQFMTVFYGKGVSEEEKTLLKEVVTSTYPEIEYYEVDGGQEVYDFILITE